MCISCVTAFDTHQISSFMAPKWLSIAFTIADFVVQRVDKVGPVSFEPPEKQPPEHAATETVDAPEMGNVDVDEAPPAEVDRPQSSFGFQAGGGGQPSSGDTPTGGDDDDDDDNGEEQFVDRAGGGGGPSPSGGNGGGGSGGNGGDNGEEQNVVQCSFRAMRTSDQHNRYEVEKARDNAGEENP